MMPGYLTRTCHVAVAVALSVAVDSVMAAPPSDSALQLMQTSPYCKSVERLDADAVFTLLVERYRRLESYTDSVVVTWRTIDAADPQDIDEVEMTMDCQATNESLTVQTSGGSFWRALGLTVPFRTGERTREAVDQVEYYFAPHMALKFSEHPLGELHAERGRDLEARQVRDVTINDRPMVQLDLRSRPDGADVEREADEGDDASTVSLFINPDSMLIERVDRTEQLDDGRTQTTTLDITPTEHRDAPAPDWRDDVAHDVIEDLREWSSEPSSTEAVDDPMLNNAGLRP